MYEVAVLEQLLYALVRDIQVVQTAYMYVCMYVYILLNTARTQHQKRVLRLVLCFLYIFQEIGNIRLIYMWL